MTAGITNEDSVYIWPSSEAELYFLLYRSEVDSAL